MLYLWLLKLPVVPVKQCTYYAFFWCFPLNFLKSISRRHFISAVTKTYCWCCPMSYWVCRQWSLWNFIPTLGIVMDLYSYATAPFKFTWLLKALYSIRHIPIFTHRNATLGQKSLYPLVNLLLSLLLSCQKYLLKLLHPLHPACSRFFTFLPHT